MSKRFALCIGVNRYCKNPSANLRFACRDARAVAAVLRDSARGGFSSVCELLDADATRDGIRRGLKQILLSSGLDRDDLALVFFSGHAALDKGDDLMLVPHDAEFTGSGSDGGVDITTAIHIRDLETVLSNSNAGRVVVLIDACHSGGAGKLLGRIKYNDSVSVIVVGAARYSEYAWESPEFQHGRFTQHFLRAANQRPDAGEWITLHQALAFVHVEMNELEEGDVRQSMEVSSHTVDQNICLFRNPLFSLASDEFTDEVKRFCQLSQCAVLPLQPNQSIPNLFIMRESITWGQVVQTLVLCTDNSGIDITHGHIQQFHLAFDCLNHTGQVAKGMIVTSREMPEILKRKLSPHVTTQTLRGVQRTLVDFEPYLERVISQFERGDPERVGRTPLKKCYIELDAEVATSSRPSEGLMQGAVQPVTSAVTDWLAESDQSRLVVLGGYGTGKTTFCLKLAYDLAQAWRSSESKEGRRIPVVFPLRRFPKFGGVDLETFIVGHLNQVCGVAAPGFSAIQSMHEAGHTLLIFDGFDEMAVGADTDTIRHNFLQIAHLAEHPDAKVMITSRPEAFLSEKEETAIMYGSAAEGREPASFTRLSLRGLSEEQIRLYLRKRTTCMRSAGSVQRFDYYSEQIDRVIGLRELAERPVLLEMTLSVLPDLVREGGAVTRPRLYEAYLSGEIARQRVDKKRDYLIKNKQRRLELMETVARFMCLEQKQELTATQIQDVLRPELTAREHGILEAYVRDFIACSFLSRDRDSYRFSHRSFMEYLVARGLAKEIEGNNPDALLRINVSLEVCGFLVEMESAGESSWRETLWGWIRRGCAEEGEGASCAAANAITILNRCGEPLEGVDLSETALLGADLKDANCREMCLRGATLTGTVFSGADLTGTDLHGADLTRCKFGDAQLMRADLSEANLKSADLDRANLRQANFRGANFSHTRMINTVHGDKRLLGWRLREFLKSSENFQNTNVDGVVVEEPFYRRSCFPPGTRIMMSDGSWRSVQDVQAGDGILSFCLRTRTFVQSTTVRTHKWRATEFVVLNDSFVATRSEPVFSDGRWVEADQLGENDTLLTMSGSTPIHKIEHLREEVDVFNLEVDPYHNFFANEVLVHNKPMPAS